jgi:hypothetical protein
MFQSRVIPLGPRRIESSSLGGAFLWRCAVDWSVSYPIGCAVVGQGWSLPLLTASLGRAHVGAIRAVEREALSHAFRLLQRNNIISALRGIRLLGDCV